VEEVVAYSKYYPSISIDRPKKIQTSKSHVRISGVMAETQTGHFLNSNVNLYGYATSLGNAVLYVCLHIESCAIPTKTNCLESEYAMYLSHCWHSNLAQM
jgi:hypothetical protein